MKVADNVECYSSAQRHSIGLKRIHRLSVCLAHMLYVRYLNYSTMSSRFTASQCQAGTISSIEVERETPLELS